MGEREPGCHPEPAVPIDAYALAIDLDEALSVLASLPERKRNLYALKVLGFSYEEIGRITGDSYPTVNRQLVRAAALIRRARTSH
jgi:DNA-directed RNA polymerase specialized sigma24 family protein